MANVSLIRTKYLGKKIRINFMNDLYANYSGREGIVEKVDDIGQLHGTWGGVAIITTEDDISIVE